MKKLRTKLTFLMTLIIGISVILLGIFLTMLIEDIYIDALGNRLIEETNMIKAILSEDYLNKNKDINMISKEIANNLSTRITIIDLDGKVLADSEYNIDKMENHAGRPEVVKAYDGDVGKEIRYSETLGIDMLYVATPIYDSSNLLKGVIRLAIPLNEVNQSIERFWNILIIGLILIFLTTLVITQRISNKITKPIEHITKIARKITNKEYDERFNDFKREDEIGQLGIAINKMADSLDKQMTTILENEKKLKTVMDNMSSGIILVDNKGKIILANPAIEWMLGETNERLVGNFHDNTGKQNSISNIINISLQTKEAIQTEVIINYPVKRYFNINVVPILDTNGDLNGVLTVLHDITKIKKLENMRTEFIASISHELRTPVTSIMGFSETLLDGTIKDEDTKEQFLKIIYNESNRINRLIVDLLDLSKIELDQDSFEFKKISIHELIISTIKILKPRLDENKLYLIIELEEVIAEVDEDRLKQVIINLLNNAIAYTKENGEILIKLSNISTDKYKIEITDTGIGIPKESLSRIFERFYRVDKARTRESGGTGLGLAIVKHIIEKHNGIINVESEVDKGTIFEIVLPKKIK